MDGCTGEIERRARKAHKCWWCGEDIVAGSVYVTWACFSDGTATTLRVHPECNTAWASMARREHGYAEAGFAEFARGCTCEHGRCECGQAAQ